MAFHRISELLFSGIGPGNHGKYLFLDVWSSNACGHIFSITIPTFWALKLKQTKRRPNPIKIHLGRSDTIKRQKYCTWLAMWLDHFEIDVIWTAFQAFLKFNFHISVFWDFWWISLVSEFLFLGIDLKTENGKSRKISTFGIQSLNACESVFWSLF